MKKGISILLALLLFAGMAQMVYAESLQGDEGWQVTLTADTKLTDNFTAGDYSDPLKDLQPGDDITLTIDLVSENAATSDWYLSNEVLHSLEDGSSAKNGAYEYQLTFNGPSGSRTLFDSTTVGGEDSEGLKDATNAMEDYLFLDSFAKGQKGSVTLKVTLDGETQGNDYQRTLADLKMNFAVEVGEKTVVPTGDETQLFLFYVLLAGSGLILAVLGGILVYRNRKERRESAQ